MKLMTLAHPVKKSSPLKTWNAAYPYLILITGHGQRYISRYETFGEAMTQYIEWVSQDMVGVSLALSEAELDKKGSPALCSQSRAL
jgi:hypothetical protein